MNGIGNHMAAECVLIGGQFYSREAEFIDDMTLIKEKVLNGQIKLKKIPINVIISLYNLFSRAILNDERVKNIEGIAFLSNWLRRSNIERLLQVNLNNPQILNQFIGKGNKRVKAQPRGVICHWIAGNIPTLALFSLFQSILVRNANVLRIPEVSLDKTLKILELFSELKIEGISGKDLLESVSIIYFPSSDTQMNKNLSLIADARIIWGGSEAIKAIRGLPQKEHCEDIVFGPKYSFAVIDAIAQKNKEDLEKIVRRFTNDIISFEQSACSSPHVFFIERSSDVTSIMDIVNIFAIELERMSKIQPKQTISQRTATEIIRKRVEYGLSGDKNVVCSKANDWTILINDIISLEEPIQSRTIWIKQIDSLFDVLPLITKKVQTIGCAIRNEATFLKFVEEATFRGVARCVAPGQMNIYDSPWDGIYLLQRLVSWSTIFKML